MSYSIEMDPEHDWVEIGLDYRCNLRCLGCRACEDTGERLTATDALAILREARANGVPNLWIGGGEPTLRPELCALVARARSMGFARVLVQTNGLRLAYPEFAAALVAAGVTDVSFNVKSHRDEVNDALTRSEGSLALLRQGIANVVAHGIRASADVLLTRSTAPDLDATLRAFAALGVSRFTLWLLSAADSADPAVAREVPMLSELQAPLLAAGLAADALGVELVSLHTPPCSLPIAQRHRYLPAHALKLVVIDPSRRSFPLESSPLEGGTFVEACGRCTQRRACAGLRRDYLDLHGSDGVTPL